MFKVQFDSSESFEISIIDGILKINDKEEMYSVIPLQDNNFKVTGGNDFSIFQLKEFDPVTKSIKLKFNHKIIHLFVKDRMDQILESLGINYERIDSNGVVSAPMPGVITRVILKPGMKVNKGDHLVVLEAMKMENVIKAPVSGLINRINVKTGQNIVKNETICEIVSSE